MSDTEKPTLLVVDGHSLAFRAFYALPVDSLQGTLVFRHLVRFSQKGEFSLPPARYQRMYAPQDQALEAKPALAELKVE